MKLRKLEKQIGNQWYTIELHYSTKTKAFYLIGLPGDFSAYVKNWSSMNQSETEDGLLVNMRAAIEEYIETKTSVRKVIVLQFKASNEILMNRINPGHYSGKIKKHYDKFETTPGDGYGLDYNFKIADEIERAGVKSYVFYRLDNDFIVIEKDSFERKSTRNDIVIPYTDEAYLFLIEMTKGFKNLAYKILDYFAESDTEALSLKMASNQKLIS